MFETFSSTSVEENVTARQIAVRITISLNDASTEVFFGHTMPFFVLIPMWLGLLLCAAVLALFRGTRVLGLYVAASSTLALICSILVSTLAIVAMAKLSSFSQSAPWWMGLLLLIGYGGSILAGAVIGGGGRHPSRDSDQGENRSIQKRKRGRHLLRSIIVWSRELNDLGMIPLQLSV